MDPRQVKAARTIKETSGKANVAEQATAYGFRLRRPESRSTLTSISLLMERAVGVIRILSGDAAVVETLPAGKPG